MRFVIFDLDGVLLETPQIEYDTLAIDWEWYWENPQVQKQNHEMVDLLISLNKSGRNVIILTARPDLVVLPTQKVLTRIGINASFVLGWNISRISNSSIFLRMCDIDLSKSHWHGAGVWKREEIQKLLDGGHTVDFVIEDFKESADEIRKIVPVLLYEHLRP